MNKDLLSLLYSKTRLSSESAWPVLVGHYINGQSIANAAEAAGVSRVAANEYRRAIERELEKYLQENQLVAVSCYVAQADLPSVMQAMKSCGCLYVDGSN